MKNKLSSSKILFNEKKYSNWVLGSGDEVRIQKIVDLCGTGKTILDVGCCGGEIGSLLIKQGNVVYGLDISQTAVNKAKKRGLVARIMDIETNHFPFKRKFDVVLIAEIIEHIADTDDFLNKIYHSLKPEGYLIVTTPNLAALGRRLLLLVGKNPHMEVSFYKHAAGHLRYFIKDTLISLLSQHQFKNIQFDSDVVNFDTYGKFNSTTLARLLPTLGRTLIIKAQK